ncbi:MAG TPA: hypothetical protein VFW67_06830 [Burkholderiaceae bacterium]|nr:hypothetical protein [Burkholderiaceae bacterium]
MIPTVPSFRRSDKVWTKTAERPLRSTGKALAAWCMAHFLGVPVPWSAVRQVSGADLLAFEHERLQHLAQSGEQVPPVLAFDGHRLSLGDVGPTVDECLQCLPPSDHLAMMCAVSADLARFHARGHWHGGAQIRNITWDGEHFARLDFEERLFPAMPLHACQIYDVLQLVMSLARWVQPLGAPAVLAVLQAYEDQDPALDLRRFLRHLLPRLQRVSRLAAWVPRYDRSKELLRLRLLIEGMQAFVRV